MNKYDFGYKIQEGSTTEWAYNIILPKRDVLEIGPAIGTLAKHLKEEKECQVDIVEIDADSGKMATQFARNACIGQIEGDIEGEWWFREYRNNKYDYIVLLDVIEHLRKPDVLLNRIYYLLKDGGKVLITTPNIAHNSIIINLMNNRFVYTDVGLLDNTHLKFFTQSSFCEMLHSSGYVITQKDYVQLRVSENEINNKYSDVPAEVEAFLRKRKMADVYQFMFVAQKDGEEDENDLPENLPYTNFKFETYLNGNLFSRVFFQGDTFETYIKLDEERSNHFRIDPMDTSGIISKVIIWDVEKNCRIPIKETNGGKIKDDTLVFFDNDPQIIIDTERTGSLLRFSCCFEGLNNRGVVLLQPLWKTLLESESRSLDIEKQFDVLLEQNLKTEQRLCSLQKKFEAQSNLYEQIKAEKENMENTKIWKAYLKVLKIIGKR